MVLRTSDERVTIVELDKTTGWLELNVIYKDKKAAQWEVKTLRLHPEERASLLDFLDDIKNS